MRLQIGNAQQQYLHLRPDTSVQIDLQSPLYFAENRSDVFPSVRTYSITVPNTPRNRLLLGRPAQLDNPADFTNADGWQIYFDGFLILEGRIEVEEGVYDSDIVATFYGGLAGNLDRLKTLNLRDLPIPTIRLGATQEQILSALADMVADADSPYRFPLIALTDYIASDETQGTFTYGNYQAGGAFVRSWDYEPYIQVSNTPLTGYSAVMPQPLFFPLLFAAIAEAGYSLGGSFFSSDIGREVVAKLLLFSNYSLDIYKPTTDTATIQDVELIGEYRPALSNPNATAADMVKAACSLFCLAPIIDTSSRTLLLQPHTDLIHQPVATNWTRKVSPQYTRARRLEALPTSFQYEAPPEGYGSGAARKLRLSQVDAVFPDVETAVLSFPLTIVAPLLTPFPPTNVYIESINEFFTVVYRESPAGGYANILFQSMGRDLGVIGEGGSTAPYTPLCNVLLNTNFNFQPGSDTRTWPPLMFIAALVPTALRYGVYTAPAYFAPLQNPIQGGEALTELLLTLYQGPVLGGFERPYLLATTDGYQWDETPIGNVTLHWQGDRGLYATWWSEWITALRSMRPVVYPTRLTATDLANIDWRKKVQIDQHAYFIKRIQVTLTANDILPAVVEYMQIN